MYTMLVSEVYKMTEQEIAKILLARKRGQFFSVRVNRPGKVRKGVSDNITKVSVVQGILAEYSNRKPVREAVESGLREAPEMPSWAESVIVEGLRFWRNIKTGQHYLPVAITGNPAKPQWYRNGEPVTLDDIRENLLASELAQKPTKAETEAKGQAQFIAVGVENIEAIH
jgi:hypothetical protein